MRPHGREAFLQLRTFPGEQGQAGRALRCCAGGFGPPPSLLLRDHICPYSRALSVRFFFDQSLENFLEASEAFAAFGGAPRIILYDNLKAAVLSRRGDGAVQSGLLELAAHYHFPKPCRGTEQ